MPAIVRSAILVAVVLACLYADAQSEVTDLVASMAAALIEVNVPKFMDAFDKNMPDYEQLKNQIDALTNQAEVSSSIEPLKNEGDDKKRSVDLDWYLEVRSLLQDGPIARRREVIHCELQREKQGWKIVSMKPVDFFAPAKLDR
jgi:hypothetical protein